MMHIPDPLTQNDEVLIESIRSILLSKEDQRIQQLQQQAQKHHYEYKVEAELLQDCIRDLIEQDSHLQEIVRASEEELRDLRMEVAILRHKGKNDDSLAEMTPIINELIGRAIHNSREDMAQTMAPIIGESIRVQIQNGREDIVDAIGPVMAESIRVQIQDARGELAEAIAPIIGESIRRQIHNEREDIVKSLAPVMGESIRAQIRHERQDMIEALYPIIGQTVQRSIREFARELQRNIDGRLKATFGAQGALRTFIAYLRGIPIAELALRDALPFTVLELFLIQHKTGLLLAYQGEHGRDSDLISSMLTVIRQFAHDSFAQKGQDEQLEEIQYGEHRIIIQNGPAAYLAVVIAGIEPAGFHSGLHSFLSDLHLRHESAFRQYDGDSLTLPNLQSKLAHFVTQTKVKNGSATETNQKPFRLSLASGSLALVFCMAFFCLFFAAMANILPVSLASSVPTEIPSINVNVLDENVSDDLNNNPSIGLTKEAAVTVVIEEEPFLTSSVDAPVMKATSTLLPTYTPIVSSTPTIGIWLPRAITGGQIWVRLTPDIKAARELVLLDDTPVDVLRYSGEWAEIQWLWQGEWGRGWVPKQWVNETILSTSVPLLSTPSPTVRNEDFSSSQK